MSDDDQSLEAMFAEFFDSTGILKNSEHTHDFPSKKPSQQDGYRSAKEFVDWQAIFLRLRRFQRLV